MFYVNVNGKTVTQEEKEEMKAACDAKLLGGSASM
jgi:hypothetical protein